MKRILYIIFTVIFTLYSCPTIAGTEKEARALLDKASLLVGRKGGATATFTISGQNLPKQSGKISIKGQKFRAVTNSAIIWCDGKSQWTYMKKTEEVNIAAPSAQQQHMINPYTFLNLYKSGFKLSVTKSGQTNKVRLLANNAKATISEMFITLNKKNCPVKVSIRQGKAWTNIDIISFQAKDQADKIFTFPASEYPNAEIIDLR